MKIFTYRYLFRTNDMADGKVCVKIVTDTAEALKSFEEKILEDTSILSCLKEYVCEYDLSFFGFTETIKKEVEKNVT